jgi:hypothetical protein
MLKLREHPPSLRLLATPTRNSKIKEDSLVAGCERDAHIRA